MPNHLLAAVTKGSTNLKVSCFVSRNSMSLTLGLVLAWFCISQLKIGKSPPIHRNRLIPAVTVANHILLVACYTTCLQWSIQIWYTKLDFVGNVSVISCLLVFIPQQILITLLRYVGLQKIVLLVNLPRFQAYYSRWSQLVGNCLWKALFQSQLCIFDIVTVRVQVQYRSPDYCWNMKLWLFYNSRSWNWYAIINPGYRFVRRRQRRRLLSTR